MINRDAKGGSVMKNLKLNFTIPDDVAEALRSRVGRRKRSAFIAAAVKEKLQQLEHEQLLQSLVEGYQTRRATDAEVNQVWEEAILEEWPR